MYARSAEFWQLLWAVLSAVLPGVPAARRMVLGKLFWCASDRSARSGLPRAVVLGLQSSYPLHWKLVSIAAD